MQLLGNDLRAIASGVTVFNLTGKICQPLLISGLVIEKLAFALDPNMKSRQPLTVIVILDKRLEHDPAPIKNSHYPLDII